MREMYLVSLAETEETLFLHSSSKPMHENLNIFSLAEEEETEGRVGGFSLNEGDAEKDPWNSNSNSPVAVIGLKFLSGNGNGGTSSGRGGSAGAAESLGV